MMKSSYMRDVMSSILLLYYSNKSNNVVMFDILEIKEVHVGQMSKNCAFPAKIQASKSRQMDWRIRSKLI